MPSHSDHIGVRAVNSVRGTHVGTYVALRVFLAQYPIDGEDVFLNDFVTCSRVAHPPNADLSTKFFKSVSDNEIVYRPMKFPCPTRVVADTLALALMPRVTTFKRSTCSYSYELTNSPDSKFCYEPYWIGYKQRRDKISELLKVSDKAMLSMDFKSFYHQLKPAAVANVFKSHLLSSVGLSRTEKWAQDYVVGILESIGDEEGLPVGPQLVHFLADMYLEEFDRKACERFSDRVFRYVDDVAVVTDSNNVGIAQAELTKLAADFGGMVINDSKTVRYDSSDWELAQSFRKRPPEDRSYGDLIYRMRVFLLFGGDLAELETAMQDAGARLPVRRLIEPIHDQEYRERVRTHLDEGRDFAIRARNTTIRDLVATAIAAGTKLRKQVEELANERSWARPQIRPYLEKYLRTLSMQALMLADSTTLRFISEVCREKNCGSEFRACVAALLDQRILSALSMPGRTQHALVELLGVEEVNLLLDQTRPDSLPQSGEERQASISSLCEFAASGCGGDRLARFAQSPEEVSLITAFSRQYDRLSLTYDGSYIEEVGSLLRGLPESEHKQMLLNTRYVGEIKPIFTTKLDGHYYS